MSATKSHEELQQTTFYKAGVDAKKAGRKLAEAISCLRPGCWQYDAFIAGYDAPKVAAGKKQTKAQTTA